MANLVNICCPGCNVVNRVPNSKLADKPKCGSCRDPLFGGKPVELTSTNFSKVINKTDIPVVVDFWAPWCGPCKMMAPIFEQATATVEPQVRMAKLNTEVAQNIASKYGIRSIPTLVIFKKGKEVARQAGAMDSGTLMRFVKAHW